MDGKELKKIGEVIINVYEDNTYSVSTSVSIDDTMDLLADAFEAIEAGTLDGMDVFEQFGGTVQ
jgi:TPP-dependent pyruvate/acetoin dehydrogenase alpha subunit